MMKINLFIVLVVITLFSNICFAFDVKGAANILSESMDRSMMQLVVLQEKTNENVKEHIERIDEMRKESITAISSKSQALMDQLIIEAKSIEDSLYKKVLDLVWRAECVAERLATSTLQRALAESINTIAKSEPCVELFGFCLFGGGLRTIQPHDITDPDVQYYQVRDFKLKKLEDLNASHGDNVPIQEIISVYANLSRLSKKVQCHFIGQASETRFIREYFKFQRLNAPLVKIIDR